MTPLFLQRPHLFVALATAAVLAAACGKPETREAPVRAVQLLTVSYEADAGDVAVYAGEVRARTESMLGFRVAGKLQSRPVDMGQRVAAGDVLATLDARDYQLGAAAADAQRAAADSQWQLAKADLARFSDLADKGFIGQAQLQRYQAAFDAAQAQATSANAGAAAQRNQLDYTVLRATHPGAMARMSALAVVAREHGVSIASHDDDSAEKVDALASLGAVISEFPTNLAAAQAARSRGMATLFGAPNILRGKSQSGNMRALDAVLEGVVDCLCGDYSAAALLPSVLKLPELAGIGLADAISLVTRNPARAAGFTDRGEIAVGKRADLVAVKYLGGLPQADRVWVAGVAALSAHFDHV